MAQGKYLFLNLFVWLCTIAVAAPLLLLLMWCFVNRWPFPAPVPAAWTLRGAERLFSGYLNIGSVVFSSIALSLFVGALSAAIAMMTARAFVFYDFSLKPLAELFVLLPVIVPATVYGMGIHMLFVGFGMNNTLFGVIIGHLICTLPFAIKIMADTTAAAGRNLEEQALILGAGPFQAFLHGSLPVIGPGIISAGAVSFLLSYTQYFLTLLLGGGKVKTLAVIVLPLIEGADRTISSVYSVVYIGTTFVVFMIFQLVSNFLASKINGA